MLGKQGVTHNICMTSININRHNSRYIRN